MVIDDTGALQDSVDPAEVSTARQSAINLLSHLSRTSSRGTRMIVISQHKKANIWTGDARRMLNSSQNQALEAFVQSEWGGNSHLRSQNYAGTTAQRHQR